MHDLVIYVLFFLLFILYKIIYKFPHNKYVYVLFMQVSILKIKRQINFIYVLLTSPSILCNIIY